MRIEYQFDASAKCPVDKKSDHYQCILRTRSTIPVERILEVVQQHKTQTMYQEDLTASLQRDLGGELETVGTHSGVVVRAITGGSS